MTKLYSIAIAASLLFIYSCKSASKSYQKGDYTDAIERGVKKLQKDPGDYETKDLVQKSYSYTVNEHEDQIRILSNSKSDNRYDRIYQEYVALQNLYNTIHQYPEAARLIKAKDYSEFVETYRDKAADVHIVKANQWASEGTKDAYREAYREYSTAFSYRPDDFELRRQRDSAYDHAVVKVILNPIQDLGGYRYGSSYQLQNFQRDIIRTLSYNMNNEFVKFYSEYEARSKDVEPDQIMDLNLSRISIGQPYDTKTSKEVSKQVVVKEIVFKEDSIKKEYATVKANIITTKRTLLSQGDLFITVRDAKGRTIWNDRFTGQHKWETQFVSYTGDERALSDTDKTSLNQNNNSNPPTEDQIMESLMRQIQNDLSYRLRNYYTRYQ
ncbi:MAG TPA: hypothetical protein VNT20_13550 [Flavisolibacter sp.]|jgi:hypothetical protein|nr:hypothetical protein [Flavisolibacter sp.]